MARLPDDIDTLQATVREQRREIDRLKRKNDELANGGDQAAGCYKTLLFAAALLAVMVAILFLQQRYFP